MICGSSESRYGPDGMLKQVSMSIDTSAPGSSDGSRPRTPTGDITSDAGSVETHAGASAACEVAVPAVQQSVSDWLGDAIVEGSTQPVVCASESGCTSSTMDEVQPTSGERESLLVFEGPCHESPASRLAAPTMLEELGAVLASSEVSGRQAADNHDPFAACNHTCDRIEREAIGRISDEQLLQDVYITGNDGNIGDRLRRAVMDGSTNAVMGLFKECNSTKKQVKCHDRAAPEAVADRFAALRELQSTQASASHSNRYVSGAAQDIMSPRVLSELSSQHLVQMNAMVSHAIQQHGKTHATSTAPESHASQQFGDVLTAFHEKNPSWNDKHRHAPAKRRDPTAKEFGDLIASFSEKNEISGFKSS